MQVQNVDIHIKGISCLLTILLLSFQMISLNNHASLLIGFAPSLPRPPLPSLKLTCPHW